MNEIIVLLNDTSPDLDEHQIIKFINDVISFINKGDMILSLNFISEHEMAELNHQYRDKEGSTDILSFFSEDDGFPTGEEIQENGDIFICWDKVKENITELGIEINQEIKRLIIHGILHLQGEEHSGYDYSKGMLKYQEEIVKHFISYRLTAEDNE